MRCTERKVRLSGEEVSFDCELLAIEEGYGVLKYVIAGARRVGGLALPAGTVTLGLYFADRLYNLYYWIAPENRATRDAAATGGPWSRDVGYYFNIAEPLELGTAVIAYRDLVVDVLVLPDGSARVLDESELPEDIDSRLRDRITETRDELLAHHGRIIAEARRLLEPYALEV